MRILILGGGIFLGRALIESALAKNHHVTAFSRGQHPLSRTDEIVSVTGNRNNLGDLQKLAELGPWDCIIDTCAYWPDQVRQLREVPGLDKSYYIFISSISAYASLALSNITESAPLAESLLEKADTVTPANYGPLKAECEREAQMFPAVLIIRPGIIVGPHDPTDRLAYWIDRVVTNPRIPVPADLLEAPVQLIDVRDLAEWILRMSATFRTGMFNAVGPAQPLACGEMLQAVADVVGATLDLQPRTADEEGDLPFYVPANSKAAGIFKIDGQLAWKNGLSLRPISETIDDTAQWFRANRPDGPKLGWTAKTR